MFFSYICWFSIFNNKSFEIVTMYVFEEITKNMCDHLVLLDFGFLVE